MKPTEQPQVVHIGKVERKRNPLGVVLCVAFLIVAAVMLVRYGDVLLAGLFTLIGLPFLLVKETR